jgi:hypothetical protein
MTSGMLGRLTPLHIPVSNFLVTPFMAIMDEQSGPSGPMPSEVHYVIEVIPQTVSWIRSSFRFRTAGKPGAGAIRRPPSSCVGSDKIWGATAMMLI